MHEVAGAAGKVHRGEEEAQLDEPSQQQRHRRHVGEEVAHLGAVGREGSGLKGAYAGDDGDDLLELACHVDGAARNELRGGIRVRALDKDGLPANRERLGRRRGGLRRQLRLGLGKYLPGNEDIGEVKVGACIGVLARREALVRHRCHLALLGHAHLRHGRRHRGEHDDGEGGEGHHVEKGKRGCEDRANLGAARGVGDAEGSWCCAKQHGARGEQAEEALERAAEEHREDEQGASRRLYCPCKRLQVRVHAREAFG